MYQTTAVFAFVLSVFSGVVQLDAQETASDQWVAIPSDVMDRINANLKDIAISLRELRADQNVLLTIRRIELAENRLAPINDELRRARQEVRSLNEQVAQMTGILDNLRQQHEESLRAGADPRQIPERVDVRQLETMIELRQEQLKEAEQRAFEVEDDLARERRRIEILDEKLEALLVELDE